MVRVLLVPDVPGWAQHRHAMGIQKYAPPGIDVTIEFNGTVGKLTQPELHCFDAVYYISIYCATRHPQYRRLTGLCASHALMWPRWSSRDWRTNGVTGQRSMELARGMLKHWDGAICRNEELRNAMAEFSPNAVTIPAGVDRTLFHPHVGLLGRSITSLTRPIVLQVGFCANIGGEHNFKGYNEIIVPLMERTSSRMDWKLLTHDYSKALTPDQMREWYQSIDVLLSVSSADGTPNPPFEAAACGCAVIATDVGALTDWQRLRDAGMIVPAYCNAQEAAVTIDAIEGQLLEMSMDRKYAESIGKQLRRSIESEYDYGILAPRILAFILGDPNWRKNT